MWVFFYVSANKKAAIRQPLLIIIPLSTCGEGRGEVLLQDLSRDHQFLNFRCSLTYSA
jgi:hypothetical protein